MRRFPLCFLVVCGFALTASAVRAEGPAPLFSTAAGTLRSGAPVTAISAPDSPWAVVLLSARVPDRRLSPDARAGLRVLASSLAQGRSAAQPGGLDLAPLGGTARARVDADTLSIALGAPADKLDDLLRGLDARLKARRALLPAQGTTPELPDATPAIAAEALAAAAPGHPDALPVDGLTAAGVVDPRLLRELAEQVLVASQLRIVVVGPRPAADLVAAAQRLIAAPLAPGGADPGDANPAAVHALSAVVRLTELHEEGRPNTTSRMWLLCADDDANGAAAARAAVLAELLGGRLEWSDDAVAVALALSTPRASAAPRAEGKVLETLAALGASAPPDDIVRRARDRVRAARLALWKDPEALALAFSRARAQDGVDSGLALLEAVTPAELKEQARRCAVGPRVIVRTVGAER